MSLVRHDSTWECHYISNQQKYDALWKNKPKDRVRKEEAFNETKKNSIDEDLKGIINEKHDNITESNVDNTKLYVKDYAAIVETLSDKHNTSEKENNFDSEGRKRKKYENTDCEKYENTDCEKYENTDCEKYLTINSDKILSKINCVNRTSDKVVTKNKVTGNNFNNQLLKKYEIHKNSPDTNPIRNTAKKFLQNKIWQKLNESPFGIKSCASNTLKKKNIKCKRRLKWRLNSGVLISLVMLNVAGLSSAVDTSTFSSTLTSRMIASFLGYPSTCSLGDEVRACTLTLSCWLRGGTRLRGCGGWLFSCCGLPEPTRETFHNSIPSSEWKYKPPTMLREVPQRNVPNNAFRRRVDDDVTQMECGIPSSRILQKRIIGGREARFAEFPWQAHVRISEFQCGGVLVSRRYVATAAHCVSRAHTRDIAVWLGAIDTSATHHPARKLGVIQKILHPLFQFRVTQPDRFDIALLKLSRVITYMSHILPICLPDHDMELRGRSGVIAGWGKTDASNSHTGTNLLRSATVPILSREQCINWHQSKQISVEIHSEMICAGHSDGHQDACLGDSGGPLIVLDSGRYYLVGITSAGFGCGVDHQPGIYHNVKLTANWIRSVISPVHYYNDNYLN